MLQLVQKNLRRIKLVKKYANKRKALKKIINNKKLELSERFEAQLKLNKLPKKCKEIFKLSKTEGLTNYEIASTLNISVKTVEAQITIAFKKIKADVV